MQSLANFFNPRFLIVLSLQSSVQSLVLKCMLICSWRKTLALKPTDPNFAASRPRQPPLIIRTFNILKFTKAERKKILLTILIKSKRKTAISLNFPFKLFVLFHSDMFKKKPKQKSSNFSPNFSSNAKLPSFKTRVCCSENVSAKLIPIGCYL